MRKINKTKGLALVTGGAGFIGSHLTDALLDSGYRVRVLDNLVKPTHSGKLPEWFNKKAEFIKGDVRHKKDLMKAMTQVNYIFHLAAHMDYHLDFSTYFLTNAASTARLYEIILEQSLPVKKIVLASSQSVYGEGKYKCPRHSVLYLAPRSQEQLKKRQWEMICPQDGIRMQPVAEKEDDIALPQIPYGVSKIAAERVAVLLGKIYKVPTSIARFSIVQGVRQSFRNFYSGALRAFSVQALSGEPLSIHEDGRQIRDFINIKDTVSALIKILEDQRADYEAFNVGSGKPTTVLDLAKLVSAAAQVKYNPLIGGLYRLNAPRHQLMDISKLKKLGWQPKYSLRDNVFEYLTWVKQYPEAKKFLKQSKGLLEQQKIVLG